MVEKRCFVRCYYCRIENELIFQVPDSATTATTPTIEKSIYCQYCNRLNIADIPERWIANPLVLGDQDAVGYRDGFPIFEGRSA